MTFTRILHHVNKLASSKYYFSFECFVSFFVEMIAKNECLVKETFHDSTFHQASTEPKVISILKLNTSNSGQSLRGEDAVAG